MLLHVHHDVEVPGRAAGAAVLALALQPEPLSGGDPGGDLHRQLAFLADAPGPAARRARLGDGLSRAPAVRARPRDGEEALLIAELSGAAALIAGFG